MRRFSQVVAASGGDKYDETLKSAAAAAPHADADADKCGHTLAETAGSASSRLDVNMGARTIPVEVLYCSLTCEAHACNAHKHALRNVL